MYLSTANITSSNSALDVDYPTKTDVHYNYIPRVIGYDDTYRSSAGVNAESQHVFIQNSRLPQLINSGVAQVYIGEVGFGAGINFINTLQCWQNTRKDHQWLYYTGFEKHPIALAQLKTILKDDHPTTKWLLENWPRPLYGIHRCYFAHLKLVVDWVLGDVEQTLNDWCGPKDGVDIWFLDGFKPTTNSAAWSQKTMNAIAQHSRKGSVAVSRSAATSVCDHLAQAGFFVEKRAGFDKKYHCLFAFYNRASLRQKTVAPKNVVPENIAIIGRGVAGAALHHVFEQHGIKHQVFDQSTNKANGPSHHKAALLNPLLSAGESHECRLSLTHLAL